MTAPPEPAVDAALEVADLPGAPYDLEFFFDPVCPYAWLTSRWAVRIGELRDLRIGWRFISLRMVNQARADRDIPPGHADQHTAGARFLRVCAAARAVGGNEVVGALYSAWGEALWYAERGERPYRDAKNEITTGIDAAALLAEVGLDPGLARAADEPRHDRVVGLETVLALDRAGGDLGTPIITFGPPDGPSFFGPVISTIPSDDDALALYDAISTLGRWGWYSELKRSNRAPLDLPLVAG